MPNRRYNAEDNIHKLREAEVSLAQGSGISQASKQLGITDQTYCRRRKSYGGMKVDHVERLRKWRTRTPDNAIAMLFSNGT